MHLVQAGHQIVLGSRKIVSPPTWAPQVEIAQIEWGDSDVLERSCDGIDLVIQAAGMNAQECAEDSVAALEFNGLATARLVAAATRAGVRRFIYLSTAHVYASPLVGTISEETCPRNLHPYATSHLAGEYAVLSADRSEQIEGIVLRLSNAFGVPVHKDVNCWMLLVNDLCKQVAQTRKLELRTGGTQQRDFISITEVCNVMQRIIDVDNRVLQTKIINVGTGVSLSVIAMAQLIQKRCVQILGFEPVLQYVPGDVSEANSILNYKVDKLAEIGVKFSDINNKMEIDRLLRFCELTFTRVNSIDE